MKHPEKFYKYTTSDTALIILKNGNLRWSSPELFNDISEFKRMPVFAPPVEEAWPHFIQQAIDSVYMESNFNNFDKFPLAKPILTLIKLLKNKGIERSEVENEFSNCPYNQNYITTTLNKHIKATAYKNARIFCLTTDPVNELMWGYYGGGSAGCVLGFKNRPDLGTPFLEAKKIKYSKEHPVIATGMDFILHGDTPALRKATLEAICYTKDIQWKHEEEWRVITWRDTHDDSGFTDFKFWPEELESVTLGAKIKPDIEAKIKKTITEVYPNCTIYKMQLTNGALSRVQLYG